MLLRLVLPLLSTSTRKYAGKATVFCLTYLAYAILTGARLPYSIAKGALRPDVITPESQGWRPFTDAGGQQLLGDLDTIFMFGYAGAMPFMGVIADRVHQPSFLALGLVLVGVMLALVGLARTWEIHAYAYFAILTFAGGCFQAIGYPCVIAIISRWFGKSRIGFLLGVWSSCTPIGTIVGKLVATSALEGGWQYAFIVPGIAVGICGLVIAACLVDDPYSVGLLRPGEARRLSDNGIAQNVNCVHSAIAERSAEEVIPMSVIIKIPGMVAYCCACFFSKLSYYAFVFWLPFYLNHALHYDKTKSGDTSTFFDWGGFVGGIVGGILIDKLRLRGVVLLAFQSIAAVMLFLYMYLGMQHMLSDTVNYIMLAMLGFTVTTPYSLITSVMATDLSRHPVLNGNSKAAATVTALLDGIGSFGACVQGLVIGWISDTLGWSAAFVMLMAFAAFSAACLVRPALQELRERRAAVAACDDSCAGSLAARRDETLLR
eukprot:TRINITY_DN34432_c0_g1_i1.p1 TRINITY_DN34432_c0_g1~~TRINITY_DN34432_c0_g1_i1.p1  ORF type:complete len:507 (-),score=68.55 TRINITY_DN34432_c0_g1_i1:66-1532(-)